VIAAAQCYETWGERIPCGPGDVPIEPSTGSIIFMGILMAGFALFIVVMVLCLLFGGGGESSGGGSGYQRTQRQPQMHQPYVDPIQGFKDRVEYDRLVNDQQRHNRIVEQALRRR
jgi:hypothetical protein